MQVLYIVPPLLGLKFISEDFNFFFENLKVNSYIC